MLEMYKLYPFALPSTAKAKNVLLILHNTLDESGGRGLPLHDRLRAA